MSTILIIILLILIFGGGGGYYAHGRYGNAGLGGVLERSASRLTHSRRRRDSFCIRLA